MIRERLKANLFINQKKFQSNTNHLLADRTGYIVNWLEHMLAGEGGGALSNEAQSEQFEHVQGPGLEPLWFITSLTCLHLHL